MARSDFAAIVTDAGAEYLAAGELERFGLSPYVPQRRRRYVANNIVTVKMYPLFPRYVFIQINDAYAPAVRLARGVRKIKPVLANENGSPWRCRAKDIERIMNAELQGLFDDVELGRGERVTVTGGALAGVEAFMNNTSGG